MLFRQSWIIFPPDSEKNEKIHLCFQQNNAKKVTLNT